MFRHALLPFLLVVFLQGLEKKPPPVFPKSHVLHELPVHPCLMLWQIPNLLSTLADSTRLSGSQSQQDMARFAASLLRRASRLSPR